MLPSGVAVSLGPLTLSAGRAKVVMRIFVQDCVDRVFNCDPF